MYILVLAENSISASFLSHGLKYENISCEPRTFNKEIFNKYLINDYDCIIIKMPVSPSLTHKYIKILNEVHTSKPVFILIDREYFLLKNLTEIPSKYIYPHDIPIRYLAIEIKKCLRTSIVENSSNILKVHDLKLNLDNREASRFKKNLFMRNKEFQLLEYLMRNTNYLLSRQVLLENVWDRNASFLTNTVDVHINFLRKKIDYKSKYKLIETIYCNGYIMHSKPFFSN